MPARDDWLDLARKLDWTFSYVDEADVFPAAASGEPWLEHAAWSGWDEPFRTSYGEYVHSQHDKESSVAAVAELLGRPRVLGRLDPAWVNGLKLHAAVLPLGEFLAVVGNLRAARFGRDSAWRSTATYGALDECRHSQIPLQLMHDFVRVDPQFEWAHGFYHSDDWVAIAARRFFDELLLCANPIEFAIATNFVFETGFTNLQFVGLASLSENVGDHLFEKMVTSIQTDEARHAQIGEPVLSVVAAADPDYAQYLLDKWFWRSWLVFAVLTGFTMDYLTPLENRTGSFKEFMEEWIIDEFLVSLDRFGLERPWYWDVFEQSMDYYHHMVYASAYTYRATVWFDMVVPGPNERAWLRRKYPESWPDLEPVWDRISEAWARTDPGVDFGVHGSAIVTFCDLCQLVLSHGTPRENDAIVVERDDGKFVFCSEPCRWIFEREPERYAQHSDVVKRVLDGDAPGNVLELITKYFGLRQETWGKDVFGGRYDWLERDR